MRHKGTSSKQALTIDDLTELADIYRRIQRIQGSLNAVSTERLPLLAASATVKACWVELSGKGMCWSFPSEMVGADGPSPGSHPCLLQRINESEDKRIRNRGA